MANVDRTRGLRPVKYQSGAAWNGQVNEYVVYSGEVSGLWIGDLAVLDGTADTLGRPGVEQLVNAVSGPTIGVVVGFAANPNNLNIGGSFRNSNATTDNRIVYIVDDPNVIFEIQADSAMDFADVGYYADITVSIAGSTTTGLSGMELDASSVIIASTSTDRLLLLIQASTMGDNEVSNDSGKWLVKINPRKHQGVGAGIL